MLEKEACASYTSHRASTSRRNRRHREGRRERKRESFIVQD
jgi:hypothetical protein